MHPSTVVYAALSLLPHLTTAARIPIQILNAPSSGHVVRSNFLGISFELAYLDEYFGNNTQTMPPAVLNHLVSLRSRTGDDPIRIRVGGNSVDSSVYVPSQTTPMIQKDSVSSDSDNQPVNFGPMVWNVLKQVSLDIGGASFLVGLPLLDPTNPSLPLVAGDASMKLGSMLDGFLLGNEPDLYKKRDANNYTTAMYIEDFRTGSDRLSATSVGDIRFRRELAGPTICCSWNLESLLNDGFTSAFSSELKYISLQHYPQNNCFDRHAYDIPYYLQHSNVVDLAKWQDGGIQKVLSLPKGQSTPQLLMSEFNSASCGGVPTVSDSFGVGSLWTIDYALQMAAVGYTAAYIHTRERGVTYNVLTSPDVPSGSPGNWTTNPPFYGLLVLAEALSSPSGNIVVDLNVEQSKTFKNSTASGYAVYDAADSAVNRLVFFNYANTSSSAPSYAEFVVPANTFQKSNIVTVKYLVGNSLREVKKIGWGGQTFGNAGNGRAASVNATWAPPNIQVECSKGCMIRVPSPGMALVLATEKISKNMAANATLLRAASTPTSSAINISLDRTSYCIAVLSMFLITIISMASK